MTTAEQDAEQAPAAAPQKTDPYAEAHAMASAYTALAGLDSAALDRAMTWLSARLDADLDASGERYPF